MAENTTPRPKMLFLDDRRTRQAEAIRQFNTFDITFVEGVRACLGQLSKEDYAEVHLDPDLGQADFVDPLSPRSGMAVVRYIERCGWPTGKPKPIFIVHSRNVFAAFLMVTHLHALGLFAFYRPFQYIHTEAL